MRPARGDSRPCTGKDCLGTMRFGRESDNLPRAGGGTHAPAGVGHDGEGWICSQEPSHFTPRA